MFSSVDIINRLNIIVVMKNNLLYQHSKTYKESHQHVFKCCCNKSFTYICCYEEQFIISTLEVTCYNTFIIFEIIIRISVVSYMFI